MCQIDGVVIDSSINDKSSAAAASDLSAACGRCKAINLKHHDSYQ